MEHLEKRNGLHKYIMSFNENENPSYQYTFQVRNSMDFHTLKEQIYDDGNGNITYLRKRPRPHTAYHKPTIISTLISQPKQKSEALADDFYIERGVRITCGWHARQDSNLRPFGS